MADAPGRSLPLVAARPGTGSLADACRSFRGRRSHILDYVTVWNCNNEEEQGVILSNLYINTCEALPIRPATWGAIKGLYGE